MFRKLSIILAVLMAISAVFAGCAQQSTPAESQEPAATEAAEEPAAAEPAAEEPAEEAVSASGEPVIIGILTYETGASADIGKYVQEAADMAVEEINAAGGVLDGRPLKIVYEDMMENQQDTINATTKLVSVENISAIIGSFRSTDIIASSEIIREGQIPYVCCGSAAGLVAEQNPYFWIPRMTDDQNGAIYAKYVVEELGMKNPAVIYMNNASGSGCAESFKKAMKEMYNIDVALEISYDPTTEKNFSPYAIQIVSSGCDGVVGASYQNDAGLIMRALFDNGFDGIKFGANSAYCDNIAIEVAGEAANGWYTVADWSYATNREKGAAFEKAYEEVAGRNANLNAAVIYDSVYLVAEAINNAGSSDPAKVNEGFAMIDGYEGALTTYKADGFNCMAQTLLAVYLEDQTATVIGTMGRVN